MIEAKKYGNRFFQDMESGSLRSAREILPVVNRLFAPKTVVDIGCGTGEWLHVWETSFGIKDFLGVEGPYVKQEMIRIDPGKLLLRDLKENLHIGRRFDLAMSLEVAEHLPEKKAGHFVTELTGLSDVVVFSAAIPGQGGTYHINEQYPEYWAKLFLKYNYVPVDCIRPEIWNNDQVEFWYKQNVIVFLNNSVLGRYGNLERYIDGTFPHYLTTVHPSFFDAKNKHIESTGSFTGFLNYKWNLFKKNFFSKK